MNARDYVWFRNTSQLIFYALSSFSIACAQSPQTEKNLNIQSIAQPTLVGSFFTTFYYVPNEASYPENPKGPILDRNGNLLADVNLGFRQDLRMEGTGILRNGRTVNFALRVGDQPRYRWSQAKWGYGVGTCLLTPYRTLAVDPSQIKLGSKLYIPEAKGMALPDGTTHDGYFMALDIGSAIQGQHVDFFCQEGMASCRIFEANGIRSRGQIKIYKVEDAPERGCFTEDPYP